VSRGRHAAKRVGRRHAARTVTSREESAPAARAGPSRRMADGRSFEERQRAGNEALLYIANATAVTEVIPVFSATPARRSRALALVKEPALHGAIALMLSAGLSGGIALVFWSLIAHRTDASVVGSVTAEVSSITFLAAVGSLNLINIFARFLPQAGWYARRLIITSYGGSALTGLLAAVCFLLTPMGTRLVLGGGLGRLGFAICVVLNSVFMIQDGGLVGFGRFGWVPVENVLVASVRLALLPVAALFLAARIGILWSWALPMAVAVLVVNVFIIGRLAGQQAKQKPSLPTFGELGRFVAIESVTTAVAASLTAFLPALVTQRLGTSQGGYFYVPWVIATMVSLLLSSTLISMVREAVANPEKVDSTIRRSMGLVVLVVIAAMTACLLLPGLVLAPLGPDFAAHGAPLLRWVGLAVPATAVNLLYWATCLIRRRPWPVFALNLATSGLIVGGVLLLGPSADIGRVGIIYCLAQWMVATVVSLPTIRTLRLIRQRKESR
jgi:O-antigen/teichoic acid export membrane protein